MKKHFKKNSFIYIALSIIPFQVLAGDFGVGFGGANIPHYMGANEYYEIATPFPIYLEDDELIHGKSGFIFEAETNLTLPISGDDLDAKVPEGYDDPEDVALGFKNFTRRGMGYIPPAMYLGLKAGVQLGSLQIAVSSTPGIQLGNNWGSAGLMSKASISLSLFANNTAKGLSCLCLFHDTYYTNSTFNKLFYGVESDQVIAGRPKYDANISGRLGMVSGMYYIKRLNALIFMGFISYHDMQNSVVEDSPLVQKKYGGSAGAAMAYMF